MESLFESQNIQLKTPLNCLLVNLSVTEFIMACFGHTTLAYNSFHGGWEFSSFACQISAFGMTFLGMPSIITYLMYCICILTPGVQSMVTLSVLAFQRYMMVIRNTQFPLYDASSGLLTLCFIWAYTLAVSIPPLLGWGGFSQSFLQVR